MIALCPASNGFNSSQARQHQHQLQQTRKTTQLLSMQGCIGCCSPLRSLARHLDLHSTAPVDPPPKLRRKRPKLDADHILSAKGLPEVYGTFYDVFMQQFKGPGHEVRDETHHAQRCASLVSTGR